METETETETETPTEGIGGATEETEEIRNATDLCFKVDGVYDSLDSLKSLAKNFAKEHNFDVSFGSKKIHCYRGYASDYDRDRDRSKSGVKNRNRVSSMKCDCKWYIKYKYVVEESNSLNVDKKVIITEISSMHNHKPTSQEKLTIVPKSTKHKEIDPIVFLHLLQIRKNLNHRLPTRLIRSFLQPAVPNSMYLSPKHILNVRSRLELLLKDPSVIETEHLTLDSITNLLKPTLWLPELQDILHDNVSPIFQHMDKIFDLLEEMDEFQTFKLESMLSLLHDADNSFLYVMGKNPSGQFTGIAWQTGVMRSSMEKFGNYIAMDAMRRELNDLHWCYMAVTILNDCNESQVVIECLAVGERHDVYKFMLESLIRFTPSLNVNHVKICSSDAFLDEVFIKEFFPSSRFIRDRYHLIESVKNRVGLSKWQAFESLFHAMVHAKDERSFNAAHNDLVQVCGTDASLIEYFQKLADDRAFYADYILSTYEGNLNLRGSTIAEVNNSSVLSFVQDLTSARSIEELVTLLLRRQQEKEKKTNHLLLNDYLKLQGEQKTALGSQLLAAKGLTWNSYNRFCVALGNVNKYTVHCTEGKYAVQRISSEAPPRMFETAESRCICEERVAFLAPCVHEISLSKFLKKDLFKLEQFHPRHYQRTALTVSHVSSEQHSSDGSNFLNDDNDNDTPPLETRELAIESLAVQRQQPLTFNVLKTAAIEAVNEALKWKNNHVSKLCLGLLSHITTVLKDPRGADIKWIGENVEKYVNSFTQSCVADLKVKPTISGRKRLKSLSEVVVARSTKAKACSKCGELFATGHHTAGNCPNN